MDRNAEDSDVAPPKNNSHRMNRKVYSSSMDYKQ
jgi:hypothetical protein